MDNFDIINLYEEIKESKINSRLIKHSTIIKLVNSLNSNFDVKKIGSSVLGKEIFSIAVGNGKRNILLWSQMHGNEPTATSAIFDLLNFFDKYWESDLVTELRKKFKFIFIPMLNPDGAKSWTRVNALNIDLNRDAVVRKAPESLLLWSLIEKLKPEYSFNLHDQRNIFNVGNSYNTATISFLSASFDVSRAMNKDRTLTMSLIAEMNDIVQEFIPGCVGRYTDEFYPTATGDNLHKLGFKNILIESGAYPNDPERQVTRKANFIALLKAFETLLLGVKNTRVEDYESIPNNNKVFYDLIIRNVKVADNNIDAIVDLGIMYNEYPDENYNLMLKKSRIENIGDLSQYKGLEEYNTKNATFFDGTKNFAELNQDASFKIGNLLTIKNGVKI